MSPTGHSDRSIDSMTTKVVVVGAGPAGLSVGRALHSSKIDFIILEAGLVAETWRQVPRNLKLLNPWWLCALDWRSALLGGALKRKSAASLLAHLEEFAKPFGKRIKERFRVARILPSSGGGWTVVSEDLRVVRCDVVVCCTGYFSNPAWPSPMFESDGSIRTFHSGEVRCYDELSRECNGGRALIVGSRISAGQLVEELHIRGNTVDLAARSPIRFEPSSLGRRMRVAAYYLYEPIRLGLQPERRANSYPGMHSGLARNLIESGDVEVKPEVRRISEGKVEFIDGTSREYSVMVLATGYDPALDYLGGLAGNLPESLHLVHGPRGLAGTAGVFLHGFDNLRSLRSRYLRGIRGDTKWLIKKVLAYLSSLEDPST